MNEALQVVMASGGILVVGTLFGLGLGWGFVAGVRAAGGFPHTVKWGGQLNAVCRHQPSEEESVRFESVN